MKEEIKKGADGKPTPTGQSPKIIKSYYSRLLDVCLVFETIGIILMVIGFWRNNNDVTFFGIGFNLASLLMQFALDTSKEDSDE